MNAHVAMALASIFACDQRTFAMYRSLWFEKTVIFRGVLRLLF